MNLQMKLRYAEAYNSEIANIILHTKQKRIKFELDWEGGVNTHGQCHHPWSKSETIVVRVSRHLVNDDDFKNTLLHELCHAYDDEHSGHGTNWKRIAASVGSFYKTSITRCSSKQHDNQLDKAVAKVTCPCCGKVSYLYKRSGCYHHPETYICGKCRHHGLDILRIK